MSIVCASPNCKYSSENEDSSNVVFINFPNDDIAKIWAHNCGRADLILKSNEELHLNYYVCSHHIEDRCYIRKENPIIIEQGAIPTLFNRNTSLEKDSTLNIFGENEGGGSANDITLTYCEMNVEMGQYRDITVRLSNLCRICGEITSDGIEIFADKGMQLKLKDKICLHMPISVNVQDLMPQKICMNCYNKLDIVHSLVTTCLRTDMRLRRLLNIDGEHAYDGKYKTLVEQCCLEVAEEMCLNDTIQNNSLSVSSDRNNHLETRIKKCPENTDFRQIQVITGNNMENDNIQNIHPELNNLVQSYTEVQRKDSESLDGSITSIRENDCFEIMCLHCRDSFKTQEIFENHKMLCDEGEIIDFEKTKTKPNINVSKEIRADDMVNLQLIIYTCKNCQKVFDNKKLFNEHEIYCKLEKIHCQTCNASFVNQEDLDIHQQSHKIVGNNIRNNDKRCGHCEAAFNTRRELSNHIVERHKGQPLFKCFACEKTYEKWSSLDIHEATHRMDKPYLCDLCGKSFKHSNNLRGHKRIHLDDSKKKRHVCETCGKAFRSRFHLREHKNQHDGNKPYACEQCGKAFYKRIQLRQHKLSHGLNKYVCPICGASFNRRGNMNTHVKRHSNGNGAYTCSVCAYRCNTMSELKLHRKNHTEAEIVESIRKKRSDKAIWQCTICDRIFSKRAVLQNHERIHSGEKITVECDECGKKLASKSSLMYHKKSIHLKERPHMCQYCGESFVSKEARLIHERIHTGERPYACKICNMQYRCSSNLSQHMKVHSNVRPYKCPFCSKSFTRRGALNVHERIHTGVKPFSCEVCGRTFSQKNDMLKHAKTHIVKTLQCEQCDQTFMTKKDLSKHIVIHEQNTSIVQEYIEVPQLQPYAINISCSTLE